MENSKKSAKACERSKKYARNLLGPNYSNAEKAETEQFERIPLDDATENYEPIELVGKPGEYTMVLGNSAISDKKYESVEKACEDFKHYRTKYMLIASAIYGQYVMEYINKVKNENDA